jgi:hypothetical protein
VTRRPLSAVVHVPNVTGADLIEREVLRRHPRAVLRPYRGTFDAAVRRRADGEVVVGYDPEPPREFVGPDDLGHAYLSAGAALVFTREVMAECRIGDWEDPRVAVAVGRVLAHELEHVRRGVTRHDARGWFAPYVSRATLLREES